MFPVAKYWVIAAVAGGCAFLLVMNFDTAFVLGVVAVGVLWGWAMTTTLLFPRSGTDASSRVRAEELSVPLIYWRPGCVFCMRMRTILFLRRTKAVWVNIRVDDAAAARVRSVNDRNETVPTVFLGAEHRTNPSPSWVAAQSS